MKPNEEIQDIKIESQWEIGEIKSGGDYSWMDLVDLYSDLVIEYENLQEELEDIKRDLEDNYKPISHAEMYDIEDRDFI